MKDRKGLSREILDHLRLYQNLGVRWAAKPSKQETDKSHGGQSGARIPPTAPGTGGTQIPNPPAARIFVPTATMFDSLEEKPETLNQIRDDLGDCKRCKLAPSRTNIVFGSGNPRAELMFVGEAPGSEEDAQGLPFVGRAGQLLTKIIEAINMKREEVYICNILKCRPPGNRNPESDEILACEPFLFRQIASVKPKVICALGTFGAQTLLKTKEPISRLRGYFMDYRGAKLMATFHPAYLLRNPNEKRKVWDDVRKIREFLLSMRKETSPGD